MQLSVSRNVNSAVYVTGVSYCFRDMINISIGHGVWHILITFEH